MIDFTKIRLLTFDCYGTLIDWESGILGAVSPVLARHGLAKSEDEVLELYGRLETQCEASPYRPYRHILQQVMQAMGRIWGFTPTQADIEALPESVKHWLPFPDTVAALQALQTKYHLGIISNIDRDLFAATQAHLQVTFAELFTAQDAQAYKPALTVFEQALAGYPYAHHEILHVAQSLFHDVTPARQLGLQTVWVNRRHHRPGWGATPPSHSLPHLEVPDLASLARLALGHGPSPMTAISDGR